MGPILNYYYYQVRPDKRRAISHFTLFNNLKYFSQLYNIYTICFTLISVILPLSSRMLQYEQFSLSHSSGEWGRVETRMNCLDRQCEVNQQQRERRCQLSPTIVSLQWAAPPDTRGPSFVRIAVPFGGLIQIYKVGWKKPIKR